MRVGLPFDDGLLLLRRAAVTMAAVLASFCTLWFAGLPLAIGVTPAVLAAVLAITLSRSQRVPEAGRRPLGGRGAGGRSQGVPAADGRWDAALRLAVVPVVALAATGVAWLFANLFVVGALLFILGLSLAVWMRRFGPRATRIGTLLSLPLVAVLVVPVQLPATMAPWVAALTSVVAALVAVLWVEVLQWVARACHVLPRADAAAEVGAAGGGASEIAADEKGLAEHPVAAPIAGNEAVATSKTSATALATSHTPATAAATSKTHATADGTTNTPATAAATTKTPATAGGRAKPLPSTRMAAQLAAALGAAFVVGRLVFPDHWAWVVLTAFIVCAANRGRGDVVYKSVLRVAGAIAGTVAAVALTDALAASNTDLSHANGALITTAVFCILFFALWLRDVNYAFWAAGVTVILTLLQGATTTAGALTTGPVLGERVVAIVAGALCGVLASWFVLPIRTEAVVRRRLADALSALSVVVHPGSGAPARLEAQHRFEFELSRVDPVARAVRAHHRATRAVRRTAHQAELIDAVLALEPLVAELTELLVSTPRLAPPAPASAAAGSSAEHPTAGVPAASAAPTESAAHAVRPTPAPAVSRKQLGRLAQAVGAARRALASTPRDPAMPTGTAAALAAITEVRELLRDALAGMELGTDTAAGTGTDANGSADPEPGAANSTGARGPRRASGAPEIAQRGRVE
ncbi:FUSC family protein [Subtercola sp. YIM 133946]|uniref:FUSC family protein n=1 Tax=Subtercola sp. YIM 133946 TaxID=3118909 RepID=UPI002F95445A